MKNYKLEKLQNGETFTTSERGNSMVPLIKSGQEHRLEPATVESVEVGDIVYAKVKGNFYSYYFTIRDLIKGTGDPQRKNIADRIEIDVPEVIITNLADKGRLKIKNIGNEIWLLGENLDLRIEATNGQVSDFYFEKKEVYPGENLNADFKVKSNKSGEVGLRFKTMAGNQVLASSETTVKSEPWIFRIFELLKSFRS